MLCFGTFPVVNKFMDKKGECQDFPSEVFRLTVPRNAVGDSFSLSLISCIEKICMRG